MEQTADIMRHHSQQTTFNRWVSEYRSLLYKVVKLYSHSPTDADDLYQEICISLWDSIPKFKGNAKESTWIYRVSLYTAIASLRKRKRHEVVENEQHIEQFAAPDDATKPSDVDVLYQMMSTLNPVDRSLMLLFLEGCSYQEIASVLGISVSNVGVKINRVKRSFSEMAD